MTFLVVSTSPELEAICTVSDLGVHVAFIMKATSSSSVGFDELSHCRR